MHALVFTLASYARVKLYFIVFPSYTWYAFCRCLHSKKLQPRNNQPYSYSNSYSIPRCVRTYSAGLAYSFGCMCAMIWQDNRSMHLELDQLSYGDLLSIKSVISGVNMGFELNMYTQKWRYALVGRVHETGFDRKRAYFEGHCPQLVTAFITQEI